MRDAHVIFVKRALIEEKLHMFAGGELPPCMLRFDAGLTAADTGLAAAGSQVVVLDRKLWN